MGLDVIELRHLKFFVALAQELSFRRAAERCHVSQPPFSVAIQQLESHLGVALVTRTSRQVTLTPAGDAYFQQAQRVLALTGEAAASARRVADGRKGRLRIGFHASMLYRGLSDVFAALSRDEPLIELELVELGSDDQVRRVLAGDLDLGFVHSMIVPPALQSHVVLTEPFIACLPPTHRLSTSVAPLALAELRDEPFICFARSASTAYFDRIVSLCVEAGFTPEVRHQVRQWLTVVSMVSCGLGVAIVPNCLRNAGLRASFRGLEDVRAQSTIHCVWLPSSHGTMINRVVAYSLTHLRA